MTFRFRSPLLAALGLWIVLLAAVGCQSSPILEPEPDGATATQPGFRAAVTGAVTYREQIALSPGAVLEVELRDVSIQDVSSIFIARQVIPNPGQVPISFRIEYDEGDIKPGNTYAVQARINYRDGSLAFINDTAYEVLTNGRPDKVEMVLVAVSPSPPATEEPSPDAGDEGEWVEVPAPVRGVRVEKYAGGYLLTDGYLLTATYLLPGGADCSRLRSVVAELVGVNIKAAVNNLEKRAKDGSPVCASEPREAEVEIPMEGPFIPGGTYRVRVHGRVTNTFTPPREGFPESSIELSPIEDFDLVILEISPPQYTVRVVSGLPRGSGCSQFNGYDVERSAAGRIDIMVTHHEVVAKDIACVEDYPTVETSIPLGADFEPGREYAVYVNKDVLTFQAQ